MSEEIQLDPAGLDLDKLPPNVSNARWEGDKLVATFTVPRWRMVVETGQGYSELTDEEKRLAKEYICTDQAPEIIESFRKMGEEMGRRHAERVDAAVMRAIGGTP